MKPLFIITKLDKLFGELTLGNSEFAKCEIQCFHLSDKLRTHETCKLNLVNQFQIKLHSTFST